MREVLRSVVIGPPSSHYLGNKLFDLTDSNLNRDGTLLPFYRLHAELQARGVLLNTVDLLLKDEVRCLRSDYFSLGMLDDISELVARGDVDFKAFLIMEPPIVAPELYEALPKLTRLFEEVYVHNVVGDGYSLLGVDRSRLRKLYWPQPYLGVLDNFWSNADRLNRVVVINGNHRPRKKAGELYSKRIEAMIALSDLGVVDLFGRGWGRWWSRTSFWLPYWLNRNKLMSIYQGACSSKYEVLSRYRYCLCFENMQMVGYVTEKIFDCFYVGTIPLYFGAQDIGVIVPPNSYVDARNFSSWREMWLFLSSMSDVDVEAMRHAGRCFLSSIEFLRYYNSMLLIARLNAND